jgi:putative heme iron utilization protein
VEKATVDRSEVTGRAFDAIGEAKRLLRTIRSASLATLNEGYPFASLTNVATDYDGSPILLLSQLAAHTRHLAADPRLSLLLCQSGRGDPLAHPRLTLLGRAERVEMPERRATLRRRFLNRHPKAELYADFSDFGFYLVRIEQAHLNGGFGRAASFAAEELLTIIANATELIATEPGEIDYINADHSETPTLLAQAFGKRTAGRWRAIGLDPEGLDVAKDDEICRVTFPTAVASSLELRRVLGDLTAEARRYLTAAEAARN